MKLWYDRPAQAWNEALPAGNGRLGCMMFGGTQQERLQLNEDSLWSGGPQDRLNPEAAGAVPRIRRLLRAGRLREAEELALAELSAQPSGMRSYQPLGELTLDCPELCGQTPQNYRRELDLEQGMLRVTFSAQGAKYEREAFASYPDSVLVLRSTCSAPGGMDLCCRLTRQRCEKAGNLDAGTVYFSGDNGPQMAFAAALRVTELTGRQARAQTHGDALYLYGVQSAVLCLAAATTYREPDPLAACRAALCRAQAVGCAALYARHLADIRQNFLTVSLVLPGAPEAEALATDARLRRAAAGAQDPGLAALYFQYGRWLLFASSRPGSLPANLQGIWNDSYFPPWDSKFTININTEMNYWPANPCGLSGCELPLFDLIAKMLPGGQRTAEKMYGSRGFAAHHNTDLWGDTAPQDRYLPASFWPMGAAWLCTHIWQHYLYSGDTAFLRAQFPVLEQSVLFFTDFLERDDQGFYVTAPSVSPENTYLLPNGEQGRMCAGPTMDGQILRELFGGYLAAAEVLGEENETTAAARGILPHLRPTQIGSDGRLLEWAQEYQEPEPGHRHISHLYGLAPGHEISRQETPELAQAARRTLECRLAHGGGHTGWSRAWIALLWARLGDGARAGESLRVLLAQSTDQNLMDTHPFRGGTVFQIDGNLGAAAAITEFLVQVEYRGVYPAAVVLLPALPPAWQSGSVNGLCLPGGAVLDLSWEHNTLTRIAVHAVRVWRMELRCRRKRRTIALEQGQSFVWDGK